ncbi:hypothetical protein OIO90_000126 [Microbotryomycetes sp. JL221]|nr:hypothetical protein OIO90_000126 [Microbotryomycetes sp. JL221]
MNDYEPCLAWPDFDPIEVIRFNNDLDSGLDEQRDLGPSFRYMKSTSSLIQRLLPDAQHGDDIDQSLWSSTSAPQPSLLTPTKARAKKLKEDSSYDSWATVQDHIDALDKAEDDLYNAMHDTRSFGYSWLVPMGKLQTREEDIDSEVGSSPRARAQSPPMLVAPVAATAAATTTTTDQPTTDAATTGNNNNGDDVGTEPVRDLDAEIEDADARSSTGSSMSESGSSHDGQDEQDNIGEDMADRSQLRPNVSEEQSEQSESEGSVPTRVDHETRAADARRQRERFLSNLDRRTTNDQRQGETDTDGDEAMSEASMEL